MGSFISTLGQVGKAIGQGVMDSGEGEKNQQGLLQNIIGRYKRNTNPYMTAPGANVPGGMAANQYNNQAPANPNAYDEPGMQGPAPMTAAPTDPAGGADVGGQFAAGGIVTKPTIAKIGEAGPEMVVPLKARPGNHVQPDILEGHIKPPSVPGLRYSRYKSFTDKAI